VSVVKVPQEYKPDKKKSTLSGSFNGQKSKKYNYIKITPVNI